MAPLSMGRSVIYEQIRSGRLHSARPFQDYDVSPRMVNGRSMERPAHRVVSVTSMRPAMRSANTRH
jgi:hypothetical protein